MPRPRTYSVEAIVLRRVDFGEADRVLVIYTRERGKLSIVAKGVRRMSSRMAGHLELFTQSELMLAKGANLDVVTQAETRNSFRAVREDLTRTSTAYLIVELMDALTEEAMEQSELFDLLSATFRALCTTEDPRLVAVHYQIRLLDVTGFRPVLMQCVSCHTDLAPGRNAFSAFLGGALCPRCGPGEPSARPISTDVLKVLRNLQRVGLPGSAHFRVPEMVMRDVERILRDLIERYTERRLRSPDLLARLRADPTYAPPSSPSDSLASPDAEDMLDPADVLDPEDLATPPLSRAGDGAGGER
jgi:DNA repair protein RecO (recombination protein O)